MDEIVGSIKRVTDIMGETTAASQQRTAGIEQINHAITEMDNVTQQNAALVEEAAAAAEHLQDQAVALSQVVAVFKSGAVQRLFAVAAPTGSAARPAPARPLPARPSSPAPALRSKPAIATSARAGRALAPAGGDWKEF